MPSAAGGSYAVLRTLGISGGVAEAGVLQLGDLNERAELVFKRGRRDTTAEIMKDLHNNMVGIAAAQWMERSGDVRNSVAILVALGHQGVLRLTRDGLHPQGDASGPDIAVARIWFDARRDEIVRNVGEALAQTARSGV